MKYQSILMRKIANDGGRVHGIVARVDGHSDRIHDRLLLLLMQIGCSSKQSWRGDMQWICIK